MVLHAGLEPAGLELPQPGRQAIECSTRLVEKIVARVEANGGLIGFDEYMHMALYEPGLGYYSGNAIKFGLSGDFVTAPEISPLFGACLARQLESLVEQGCAARVLEFGAGSGKLCAQILQTLPLLESYLILDPGAASKQRQQDYLRNLLDRVHFDKIEWLTGLPADFDGIVIANEVLDAMPVNLLCKNDDWCELGVTYADGRFAWKSLPARAQPLAAIRAIEARHGELPSNYRCEVNLNLAPWLKALAQSCNHAVAIIIDYGYEQGEYYHPARRRGTLNCYYRHRVHSDPLVYPGLQDITAFVDFDACADAAEEGGFTIVGLVTQRHFLLANGLLDEAQRQSEQGDTQARLALSQQVRTLTMPDEMGQCFKVLALTKNLDLEIPAMRRGSAGG